MKRLQVLLAVALATLPVSCGENETVAPDETPPGRVTDLMVKSAKPNVITLRWTTPGDNGRQGTATSYQVRWSTDWITESNFDRANKIPDPPVPGAAGSVELFSVPNMDITRVIHFALRTMDEVGLVSPVSNDARWTPAGFPVQYYTETVILNKSPHPPAGIASPAKIIFHYGMRAGISQGDDRPDKLRFLHYFL